MAWSGSGCCLVLLFLLLPGLSLRCNIPAQGLGAETARGSRLKSGRRASGRETATVPASVQDTFARARHDTKRRRGCPTRGCVVAELRKRGKGDASSSSSSSSTTLCVSKGRPRSIANTRPRENLGCSIALHRRMRVCDGDLILASLTAEEIANVWILDFLFLA